MSRKQWKRLSAVEHLTKGDWTNKQAAQALGLSERQMRRLKHAVHEHGPSGVKHGSQGRKPSNTISEATRDAVVSLRRSKYAGFNDCHFYEKLQEVEVLLISRASVQRILRAAGIASTRKRGAKKHYKRRQRKAQEGAMLLWDGSSHKWLEERGPSMCLMGAIDDATGQLMPGAHFIPQESAVGYLRVLRDTCLVYGLPWSIYMDRHGSLKRNDKHWTLAEQLQGEQHKTQVGRALQTLNITPIYALSPQAKGRIERLWNTLQDRLVSELRLIGAVNIEQANAMLEAFRLDYNARFGLPAAQATAAWRPKKTLDIEATCALTYEMSVGNDNTVKHKQYIIDIAPGPKNRSYARETVTLHHLLDGRFRVYHKGLAIAEMQSDYLPVKTAPRTKPRPLKKRAPAKKRLTFAQIAEKNKSSMLSQPTCPPQ